jgi:hypothetical protein
MVNEDVDDGQNFEIVFTILECNLRKRRQDDGNSQRQIRVLAASPD